MGLAIVKASGGQEVEMKANSQVVVKKIMEAYLAKGQKLIKYHHQVQENRKYLNYFQIKQIPRDNFKADRLARAALAKQEDALPWKVSLRMVDTPAVGEETLQIGEITSRWVDNIVEYLETGKLSPSLEEARKIKWRAARFTMVDGVLYRRGFLNPLTRCVMKEEVEYVIREIYEGIYENHLGG